jgi:hypothetical protein
MYFGHRQRTWLATALLVVAVLWVVLIATHALPVLGRWLSERFSRSFVMAFAFATPIFVALPILRLRIPMLLRVVSFLLFLAGPTLFPIVVHWGSLSTLFIIILLYAVVFLIVPLINRRISPQ